MSAISFDNARIVLGGRAILEDVSFSVALGEFVGVLGPNGAGKTTLMRAILGLLPLTAGHLEVLGAEPRRGNPAIGYMPQSRRAAPLPTISGMELLLSARHGERWGFPRPSRADRDAVETALGQVGASAIASRPIGELSGGERQRLFIAQAIVGQPKLLLLDEPLISLDPARQRDIVHLVRDLSQRLGIAVLFSAHEVNPLLGAIDKVLYLGHGHAAIGTVDEVVNDGTLSALYRTTVRVVRVDDRIFVLAEDGALDGHGEHEHDHDHHNHVHAV